MAEKAIPVAPENLGGISESTRGRPHRDVSITPTKCSGNKCGHNPLIPLQFASSHKRPWLIQKLQRGLFRYYFRPLRYLGIEARTERREAIMRVGQCIIDYLDLTTLKVRYLNIFKITKYTGLGYKRVIRALNDLKEAGFIFVQRRYEQKGDKFIGKDSIRTVSMRLIKALGIDIKELIKYRKKKERENQPKEIEDNFNRAHDARIKEYLAVQSKDVKPSSKSPFKTITELIRLKGGML